MWVRFYAPFLFHLKNICPMKITHTKILANGKMQFYTGRKVSTQAEAKAYIKANTALFSKETTMKDSSLKKYWGNVKGGKSRAANSLYDKSGHFLTGDLQKKALKNMGVDLDALMKAKNVGNIRQLFKDHEGVKKSFDKLLTSGIEAWFNSHSAIDKIEDFTGKDIIINSKKVDKLKAIKIVNDCLKGLKRKFDSVDASIKFRYRGLDELVINIPTKKEISEMDEDENMEDTEFYNDIQIYRSGKKKK